LAGGRFAVNIFGPLLTALGFRKPGKSPCFGTCWHLLPLKNGPQFDDPDQMVVILPGFIPSARTAAGLQIGGLICSLMKVICPLMKYCSDLFANEGDSDLSFYKYILQMEREGAEEQQQLDNKKKNA
jgi:hypothetical protein